MATCSVSEATGVDDSASDMSASLEVNAEMYAALQEEHTALHAQMHDTKAMLVTLQDLVSVPLKKRIKLSGHQHRWLARG